MSFAQHLKNILRFNLYLFIITLRHNNKIQEQGESQKFLWMAASPDGKIVILFGG